MGQRVKDFADKRDDKNRGKLHVNFSDHILPLPPFCLAGGGGQTCWKIHTGSKIYCNQIIL